MKYKFRRQTGGQGSLVNMESKEVYKSPDGKIMRVSDDAPTHDDGVLINGNTASKAPYNEGGVVLPAESVLSATHENRDEDDDSYGLIDEIIKIKPKELNQYAGVLGFKNIKSNKAVSPSKAFELLRDSKLKEANKLLKPKRELYSDDYTKASVKANEALANSLPTDEDIYDMLFEIQESKKAYLNTRKIQKAQTGINNTINYYKSYPDTDIDNYKYFKNTLPNNLKNTPEQDYAMEYYWKNNGKPKSFSYSMNRDNPMFSLENDGLYHAPSVEPNTLRFLKPKHHKTIQMELDWYNSNDPEAVQFKKDYDIDTKGEFYKYIPRTKK